jgi:hypothetical protein
MAVVKGVKEKVHLPLYDSIFIKAKEQLSKSLTSNVLRFFVDVTGKTKLLTNMQAASLLPHWNTFEARAMRVVISDLAAQFPDAPTVQVATGLTRREATSKSVDFANFSLRHLVEFKRRIEQSGSFSLKQDDLDALKLNLTIENTSTTLTGTDEITIDLPLLKDAETQFEKIGRVLPPNEQVSPNNGFGSVIGKLIYNSVTTFYVGEKIMIQMPTWFFPAGAGPYSEDGKVTTHGEPSPEATFRFAEPIFIDTQQNFRVEIEIPENDVLTDLQRLYGPFFIWIVLDGFMTRDVQ